MKPKIPFIRTFAAMLAILLVMQCMLVPAAANVPGGQEEMEETVHSVEQSSAGTDALSLPSTGAEELATPQPSADTEELTTPQPSTGSEEPTTPQPSTDPEEQATLQPADDVPSQDLTNLDSGDSQQTNGETGKESTDQSKETEQTIAQTQTPANYTLTVNLNGGQVNGMVEAGWKRDSSSNYIWTKTVTETAPGEGVGLELYGTLGGLIPGEPYRADYTFTGWQVSPELTEGKLNTDTTVTAQWKEALYQVSFKGENGTELGSVEVPYGATLWTAPDEPWSDSNLTWIGNVAMVNFAPDVEEPEMISVTRHSWDNETTNYYYTFRRNELYYFTYGGEVPVKDGHIFTAWKMTSGGQGFTVLQDCTFTAQFAAEDAYVFNIYYYYEDGTKVEGEAYTTRTITKTKKDIQEGGTLTFDVSIPDLPYSIGELDNLPPGVTTGNETTDTDGKRISITVDVEAAFAENTSATKFLALTVLYQPQQITYHIAYHQQSSSNEENYEQVGTIASGTAPYGSRVVIPDRPTIEGASFDGFQVSAQSQNAISDGVLLMEGAPGTFWNNGTCTIHIYYDRASFFIYFQTQTEEVQVAPKRVTYGTALPDSSTYLDQLKRNGYADATETDLSWYSLGEDGNLKELDSRPEKMPSYDLYAVVNWEPATTSLRILYWVESRNASSYQNAYVHEVEGVTTESKVTVNLSGGSVTINGLPQSVNGNTVVSDGFGKLMQQRYGNEAYKTFFSYNPELTKSSPGNVADATETGTGTVTEGAIKDNSYVVKVKGDGTTTINVYYSRNLYTLEFVLGRENGTNYEVATATPGSFSGANGATWTTINDSITFSDFPSDRVQASNGSGTYGNLNVQKVYQIASAVENGDTRAAIGRYGTKTIYDNNNKSYTCNVYTLTARFEADIAALWPTSANFPGSYNYNYISMGTDAGSYYRNVFATKEQKNILAAYSSMDRNVVAAGTTKDSWTAQKDPGNGTVAHQMIAYWNNPAVFDYYFLYETLDAGITSEDNEVEDFSIDKAERTVAGGTADVYTEGQLVSYEEVVYEFRTSDKLIQGSTSTKDGQNQPAKQGFVSAGKQYAGNKDHKGAAWNAPPGDRKNIYFFYSREDFTLSIQNTGAQYKIPEAILTEEFSCLSQYQEEVTTLQQLGWESVTGNGTVTIRYGGCLDALSQKEIIDYLTTEAVPLLKHPISTSGENQYYFSRWYRNSALTMPIDWTSADMKTIASNITIYTGWFTPRYTTSYVLNGGTWKDTIHSTLIAGSVEGKNVFLYYPHMIEDPTATVYWYQQTQESDRLYVNELYQCQISDVLEWNDATQHWRIKSGLTIDQMISNSNLDLTGTRLINRYFCYMGADGTDSTSNHEKYININATVGSVLSQPTAPERNGYRFQGWFHFGPAPASDAKRVYLEDVLLANQSLASYDEDYVYLDAVGDAYLLWKDETGRLYYYPDQIGYRFSYTNGASVVSQSRSLYAAWEPTSDAVGTVYHLVEKNGASSTYTSKDGKEISISDTTEIITIGETEYYILKDEPLTTLYTGSTELLPAQEYYVAADSKKWLPVEAEINLHIGSSTQTVTEDTLHTVEGNTYRIETQGTYHYYAFFVYEETDSVMYNVYAIDLAVAVAEGALTSYQDTFDRTNPPTDSARYVLQKLTQDFAIPEGNETTILDLNAPAISGYTVYDQWTQKLQLGHENNNAYFYYVKDGSQISYSIKYYLMHDGSYSEDYTVTFSGVPGVSGEIFSLKNMVQTYDRLVKDAQTYSGYADSSNENLQALYKRYKDMTVTWINGGEEKTFTVSAEDSDTLDLSQIQSFTKDYYLSTHSPSGETLVLSDGAQIDVYLARAELVVQKVNSEGDALSGAVFELYQGGEKVGEGTSGSDGRIVFHNLNAIPATYTLKEVNAPPGYNRIENDMSVTVPYTVAGTTSYSVTYTVVNTGIPYLPEAGAFGGVYITIFLGEGMMAAALVCVACLSAVRRKTKSKTR